MALAHYQGYVENVSTGKALEGAVIRVYSYPGNVLQSTFADASSTPKPVVSSDSTGGFDFYIADGAYDLEYVYNGDVLERLVNVPIFNPANYAPSGNVDTILGVPAADGDLGTFTGTTIPNDSTVKGALQSLETATELRPTSTTLAASGGSALVGFLQAGTGAVARTAQAKGRDFVSVKDFGAVGDGVADDLVAMQAAHNTGKLVYYPAGTYKFTAQITIAAGGIIGAGKTLTNLNCTDTSANAAVKFTGPYTTLSGGLVSGNPTFRDFTLNGNLLKTTGAGIQLESATNEVSYASFRSIGVSYFPINIDFVKASLWKMIDCDILGHTVAGVRINNTFDNDAGDSTIMGCVINTTVVTADNILHLSSGGLKIIGNKLLGGRHGYSLEYTGTANTSIVIIANNSIENFSGKAITFAKISGGLTEFINVQIIGNEISVSLSTTPALLIANDGGTWLKVVNITGNIIQLPGVTDSFGIALTGVTSLTIASNTFKGNGLNSTAIALTSCVDAQIGTNTYTNIAVPYLLTTQGANNTIAFDANVGTTTGVLNTTATTLFALPITRGLYEVYACLPGGGITYQSAVRIASDGFTLAIVGGDAAVAGMLITISGLNIQANQNSGATQTVAWGWRRIA